MDLKNKKQQLFRLIKLGMELYRAELVVGCTEKEVSLLDKDEDFNQKIKEHEAIGEKELLDKLEDAIDIGVDKGSSSAIQWKLERLNSNRWGSKEIGREAINPNLVIELVGRHSNGKND